jgi:hypothetical protein
MHTSRIAYTIILFAGLLTGVSMAQQVQKDEILTISTYYPSPYGVYRRLEVKRGLAVGGSGFTTVNGLTPGQMFVNNSLILNTLLTTPLDSAGKAGQLIYVGGTARMLKYHDGSKWVNVTLTPPPPPPCPPGNSCQQNTTSCTTVYRWDAQSAFGYSCTTGSLDCYYRGSNFYLPTVWAPAPAPCMITENCCPTNHPDYTAMPPVCYSTYSATATVCTH